MASVAMTTRSRVCHTGGKRTNGWDDPVLQRRGFPDLRTPRTSTCHPQRLQVGSRIGHFISWFDLLLYAPGSSYDHIGASPPFYATSTQHNITGGIT